jgi:hypothetical protein
LPGNLLGSRSLCRIYLFFFPLFLVQRWNASKYDRLDPVASFRAATDDDASERDPENEHDK